MHTQRHTATQGHKAGKLAGGDIFWRLQGTVLWWARLFCRVGDGARTPVSLAGDAAEAAITVHNY